MNSDTHHRHHHSSHKRSRSRSPNRSSKRHHSASHHLKALPFNAQPLHKHDFAQYKSLFSSYLSIQKQLDIDDLDEYEVKGRWKSFLGKWNRGDLAEGWYEPDTKRRAEERSAAGAQDIAPVRVRGRGAVQALPDKEDDDDDDDGYGPALPTSDADDRDSKRPMGPAIPNLQDLQHRQELTQEDRNAHRASLRYERKSDRAIQKERLEELVPRAEPGSRERQLEKKREVAAGNRAFKDAKEGGVIEEVGESELMGEEGGVEEFKAKLKARERQKTEREIKKEEVLRARQAEREERVKGLRIKEERTVEMLRELAKARFG